MHVDLLEILANIVDKDDTDTGAYKISIIYT